MKLLIRACVAAALLGLVSGAPASTIELKDGSRIEGEVKSIENGVYTVISPSIGTVHVAQSNIARIVYSGDASNATHSPGKAPAQNEGLAGDIQQLQMRMAQDQSTMQSILSLQSDPQIQAILNDPAIMKAIQDGDYMSLLNNAKIQGLESNAHVQQLLQQQGH